ncbi:hypothetical protein GBF38_005377, partial [Nibea albiflora]
DPVRTSSIYEDRANATYCQSSRNAAKWSLWLVFASLLCQSHKREKHSPLSRYCRPGKSKFGGSGGTEQRRASLALIGPTPIKSFSNQPLGSVQAGVRANSQGSIPAGTAASSSGCATGSGADRSPFLTMIVIPPEAAGEREALPFFDRCHDNQLREIDMNPS